MTLAKAKQTSNKKTKVSVIIKMPFRSTSPTERERESFIRKIKNSQRRASRPACKQLTVRSSGSLLDGKPHKTTLHTLRKHTWGARVRFSQKHLRWILARPTSPHFPTIDRLDSFTSLSHCLCAPQALQRYACHTSVFFEWFTGDVLAMFVGMYPPYMTGDGAASACLLALLMPFSAEVSFDALSFHTVPRGTPNCLHSS